ENPLRLRGVLEAVYPYSRTDLRDIMELPRAADGIEGVPTTTLLGLYIAHESRDPDVAWATSRLAGDFAADAILRFDLLRSLDNCLAASSKTAREAAQRVGANEIEQQSTEQRLVALRTLAERNPDINTD